MASTSYMFIKEADLYIVGASKGNANASLVFEALYTLVKICKHYFGGTFDEETVRGNFVFMYEVLDGKCLKLQFQSHYNVKNRNYR